MSTPPWSCSSSMWPFALTQNCGVNEQGHRALQADGNWGICLQWWIASTCTTHGKQKDWELEMKGGKKVNVQLWNWQQETSPAIRHGAIKNSLPANLPSCLPESSGPPSLSCAQMDETHTHTHTNIHTDKHTPAQPALFEMFVLLMCSTSGRIRVNARRPQTLRSVVLRKTNHSPSLARTGKGVREERTREREERENECWWSERESAGRDRMGWQEREVGDCFTNRIPLINHPVWTAGLLKTGRNGIPTWKCGLQTQIWQKNISCQMLQPRGAREGPCFLVVREPQTRGVA